ncbi:MAG: D-alanyl-D-alanine carboxypeptidase family protein [Litorimonas sp.]
MREIVLTDENCESLGSVNHSETRNTLVGTMFVRFFINLTAFFALCLSVISISALPAMAQDRYASIIVDADNLDVLHARQIDELRFPASLTKVMTLYLVFDEIQAGRLSLSQPLKVSNNAAKTPPVKMGLKAGKTITVHELIQAVAVKSYNDAAVVLAEHIGGSEARFAELMTNKARELGMKRTTFKTASGLPHPEQKTTARDMAKLANAMLTHHAKHYHYFGQKHYRGKPNTNALLFRRADVDGFKTGYTRASGYNLMVSAKRNGRRQIAVVLGGATSAARNEHMNDLIDRGFNIMNQQPVSSVPPVRFVHNQTQPYSNAAAFQQQNPRATSKDNTPVIIKLRGTNSVARPVQTAGTRVTLPKGGENWSVQIKGFQSETAARAQADSLHNQVNAGKTDLRSGFINGVPIYHARLTGLSAKTAQEICTSKKFRLALGDKRCLIIAP